MRLDYLSIALFALLLVGIAVYTRKRAGSVDDFLLAGKRGRGMLTPDWHRVYGDVVAPYRDGLASYQAPKRCGDLRGL